MSSILAAADILVSRGIRLDLAAHVLPPEMASDILPAMVRELHQPFVDQIGIAAIDPAGLAEYAAADGIEPEDAAEARTALLRELLGELEQAEAHATGRQQRRALARRRRAILAAIERAESQLTPARSPRAPGWRRPPTCSATHPRRCDRPRRCHWPRPRP